MSRLNARARNFNPFRSVFTAWKARAFVCKRRLGAAGTPPGQDIAKHHRRRPTGQGRHLARGYMGAIPCHPRSSRATGDAGSTPTCADTGDSIDARIRRDPISATFVFNI